MLRLVAMAEARIADGALTPARSTAPWPPARGFFYARGTAGGPGDATETTDGPADDRRGDGRSGPEGPGRRHRVRLSRRRRAADLRRDLPAERHPPHPRAPRAGRGPRRRGLRPLDRQARRRPRHLRPRRHQRRHRHDRRADGFDPDGRPHRPGPHLHDRQRRLPGGRHRRHHPPLHQAQLAGEGHREARRDHPPGLPRRHPRPPRPGARRHPQGRPVRHRRLHRRRTRRASCTTSRAPRATRTPSSPPSRRWRRPSAR